MQHDNPGSDNSAFKKLTRLLSSVFGGAVQEKEEAPVPSMSDDLARNHKAQLDLIEYYASEYKAEKHEKEWFQNRFDLKAEGISDLYDEYQANKSAYHQSGCLLFTTRLFDKLQEEAQYMPEYQHDPDRVGRMQRRLKHVFCAARYHAHSKALMNGVGDFEKQRKHVLAAASDMDKAAEISAKLDVTFGFRNAKELGYPGATFELPADLVRYKNMWDQPLSGYFRREPC